MLTTSYAKPAKVTFEFDVVFYRLDALLALLAVSKCTVYLLHVNVINATSKYINVLMITTSAHYHSVLTSRMLFLLPNQQCQSTEGNSVVLSTFNKL